MPRVVLVVLLAVAVFQIGAWLAVVGTIARGEAPAAVSAGHLPPSGATSEGDLATSPRRGEFVDVPVPGSTASVRTWVVHPERSPAPVVVVVHDVYRLSNWVRSIADALAAEGFLAVAPDLPSGLTPDGAILGGEDGLVTAVALIGAGERTRRLDAVRSWALDLPAAGGRFGLVGFSWGGSAGFAYAVEQPELDALVVFYGDAPRVESDYSRIGAPVLGLYGGDLQTAATMPGARGAMAAAGRFFEGIVYDGATVFPDGPGGPGRQAPRDGGRVAAHAGVPPRASGGLGVCAVGRFRTRSATTCSGQ